MILSLIPLLRGVKGVFTPLPQEATSVRVWRNVRYQRGSAQTLRPRPSAPFSARTKCTSGESLHKKKKPHETEISHGGL